MVPPLRNAIVTGAGTGLGRVIARRLAEEGLGVALVGRTEATLREVDGEIRARGGRSLALVCDHTDSAAVARMAAAAEAGLGPVDLLVNNAAVMLMQRLEAIGDEQWDHVLRTNLTGPFYCCRALVPAMRARGGGVIANVSATAGKRGSASFGAFAASKMGLQAITESLAKEVKADGIHVFSMILDGAIDIPKMRAFLPGGDPARWLDPEEIARALLFVARQDSRAWSHELWLRPALDTWM